MNCARHGPRHGRVLRLPVARDSALLTKVARIFFEAIRAHLRAKVGGHGLGDRVEIGSISVVQRFGGVLHLNPPLHVLVADGEQCGLPHEL